MTYDPYSKTSPSDKDTAADTSSDKSQTEASAKISEKSNLNGATFGAYASPDKKSQPDLSSDAWKKSEGKGEASWTSNPKGRLVRRLISRGILGAGAFALGGMYANTAIKEFEAGKGVFEQKNTLSGIAKFIDIAVGKPIQWGVKLVAGEEAAINAVRFRPTKFMTPVNGQKIYGRTLGEEVVGVTFDFFCASIGDAIGRDLFDMADPNIKKPWLDKEGHVSVTESVNNLAKSAWRYVSLNGGEDWAVAIPYVYFMKGQRAVIDKFSPGFKYDFDRSLNGGSFKINNDNKIVGSFGFEGALDLQTRFTVYNIGTLMYREAYQHIADTFNPNKNERKPSALYGAPDKEKDPNRDIFERMGDLAKWTARSVIKGTMYMTPATPLFWLTRTAQSKHTGLFVNQEKGVLEHFDGEKLATLRANELRGSAAKQKVFYGNFTNGQWQPSEMPKDAFQSPLDKGFKPYGSGVSNSDKLFDCIGDNISHLRGHVNRPLSLKFNKGYDGIKSFAKTYFGTDRPGEFTDKFINASIAYTPYMYAKAETAELWDNGKMDMATERMIDGATHLNWGEFKAGAHEVWKSFTKQTLDDPAREAEAARRVHLDSSAPADFRKAHNERSNYVPKKEVEASADSKLSWKERVVSGKDTKSQSASEKFDSRPRSHAENEAMKKALEELQPPSSAIH